MPTSPSAAISIKGARVHNLKNVSLELPKGKLIVMTGLSGSGKSSIAFDTIHAEGQRRYMESLSSYARQFLELQDRPDVDEISGLSPTIAIDQKAASQNPRSTVGTVTEIYDHLRILFARAGRAHCPQCGAAVVEQTASGIAEKVVAMAKKGTVLALAPVVRAQKGEHKVPLQAAKTAGYHEARFDGTLVDIPELLASKVDKTAEHDVDIVVGRIQKGSALDVVEPVVRQALDLGNGLAVAISEDTGDEQLFSQSLFCAACDRSLPPLEPRLFSFNSPHGACPSCTGLGTKLVLDAELVAPNRRLTVAQGAIQPWTRIAGNQTASLKLVEAAAQGEKWPWAESLSAWPKAALKGLFEGTGKEYLVDGKPAVFGGVLAMLEEKYRQTDSEYVQKEIEAYMRVMVCPGCDGRRLRPEALAVTVAGKGIAEVVALPIDEALPLFEALLAASAPSAAVKGKKAKPGEIELSSTERLVAAQIAREVCRRLRHLLDVGLSYLSLDRSAVTLSGGESQRVRLAVQLGAELSGVIYVLDEPSIGLHPRDTDRLVAALRRLRDLGNTVLVVEHDKAVMEAADWLVDVGPGAGALGGQIMASGPLPSVKKDKNSLTGAYLSGRASIDIPKARRKGNGKALVVKGANAFNLKKLDARIPLGQFVCVTGVSGSGKSTLVLDILGRALAGRFHGAKELPAEHASIDGLAHLDKVVMVDQSPIGRTPRSNAATYTGIFTAVRDLFTETPEAKMRRYDAGMFSFNVKGGGRCEACVGEGYVQISMQFLPDVYVECGECRGTRYRSEALEIHYRGKSIADVLNLSVADARPFFADQPALFEKLGLLEEVGLGYLRLGQPATTLSGGEAQRVKLATELARRATGKTIYILDEPTTGLHFEDVKRLLGVLQALVDRGNSVLVIEHDLDVAKCADWIIDMGPDGGARGGKIVAEGTPEQIAKTKASATASYLKDALAG
jgi:excinuclease ABC subunit A